MTSKSGAWRIDITRQAWADLDDILHWTAQQFGPRQSAAYQRTIFEAVTALAVGPDSLGVKRRDDIRQGLGTLHVTRRGQRGRHLLCFRIDGNQPRTIQVMRILHDGMDLERHLNRPTSD